MPAYFSEEQGTWRIVYRVKDLYGISKQKTKRGFKTKAEAEKFEAEVVNGSKRDLSMTFEAFLELYLDYKRLRVKESTFRNKESVIRGKIAPYFSKMKLNQITPRHIIEFQNYILSGEGNNYSPSYVKRINNELRSIFRYACNALELPSNPAERVDSIGKSTRKEMSIWIPDEYKKFISVVDKDRVSYYVFCLLYSTGMRIGEAMALTKSDFLFDSNKLRINKTYHRYKSRDIVTEPKTACSIRTIEISDSIVALFQDYFERINDIPDDERIFPVSTSTIRQDLIKGVKQSGVKKIRIHDFRHSHVTLLIELGFTAVAIGARVGHEATTITYKYAHVFNSTEKRIAAALDRVITSDEGDDHISFVDLNF